MDNTRLPQNRRVSILKKLIVIIPVILFLSLLVTVICLLVSNHRLKEQIAEYENGALLKDSQVTYDHSGVFESRGVDVVKGYDALSKREDALEEGMMRQVYLTFDDGPSIYTNEILDILKKYDVKATFFVLAKNDEESLAAYQRIVDEGHTLAMHSFSHNYSRIYESVESFSEDISKIQEFLYENTGVWCRIYRFPGGSSNSVTKVPVGDLITYLNDMGITYFDWNIVSNDAIKGTTLSAETIRQNCVGPIGKYDECVILMHDSKDRHTTVEALPLIIEDIKARGDCQILPITDETVPVQHRAVEK